MLLFTTAFLNLQLFVVVFGSMKRIFNSRNFSAGISLSNIQIFALVNVIGGVMVVGGYAIFLYLFPAQRESLWGGIEGGWRVVFTVSMLLAAGGYITFFYLIVSKLGVPSFAAGIPSFLTGPNTMIFLCALFLAGASVWMPSTIAFIRSHDTFWWIVAAGSLWVTALSLILMIVNLYGAEVTGSLIHKYLALAGLIYIWFHCLVLDAIVWIAKFPH